MIAAWWLAVTMAVANPDAGWRLVAAYDSSALAAEGDLPASFSWRPRAGMAASCGEVKRPDGLGIFEAEAVAAGLTPALVLVLERTGADCCFEVAPTCPERAPGDPPTPCCGSEASVCAPLDVDDLRVSIGREGERVLLQPMVDPRWLRFRFTDADGLHGQRWRTLIETQLAVETCLEHKVGRGWLGAESKEQLRQAYLLDAPPFDQPSRRPFGGQAVPVPALRGPPEACLVGARAAVAAAGATSDAPSAPRAFGLQPSDVWAASLGPCSLRADPPSLRDLLPLVLPGEEPTEGPPLRWQDAEIAFTLPPELSQDTATRRALDEAVRVTLTVDGVVRYDGPLFERLPYEEDDTLGLVDLLAHVPYTYPQVRASGSVYATLILPDWQLVEAMRRLDRAAQWQAAGGGSRRPAIDHPMSTDPEGIVDGVGTVLLHPELLFVQWGGGAAEGAPWPNLASVLRGRLVEQPFGHAVDARAARSPIVAVDRPAPGWDAIALAQRSVVQALLLLALTVVGLGLVLGLRRVRDLWTRVPTERASYWPGVGEVVVSEAPTTGAVEGAGGDGGGG